MKVTVLGKSPSWQDTDGACSGYLVQEDNFTLLLDCGNGVFAKLRRFCDYSNVDAVLISHLHADHILDLIPFSYALTHGLPSRPGPGPLLVLPAGAAQVLRGIVGSWGSEDLVERAFDVHEYVSTAELSLGPFRVRFCPVPHYTESFAVELDSRGRRLTYSGDCAPNPQLVSFAASTDLLLIEATLAHPEPSDPRGHLTPREAGEHGAASGARRLVLTHFSDMLDAGHIEAEAIAGYGGPVELAAEGAVYDI